MFTLLQVLTFDDWSEGVIRHLAVKFPYMFVVFPLLVFMLSFVLLNMVVGAIVETTIACAKENEEQAARRRRAQESLILERLKDILRRMDVDRSGTITPEEVREALEIPEVREKLMAMDFPMDNPEEIFEVLEKREEIPLDEFLAGIYRMKGTASSRGIFEVNAAIKQLQQTFDGFQEEMDTSREKVRRLATTVDSVTLRSRRIFHPSGHQLSEHFAIEEVQVPLPGQVGGPPEQVKDPRSRSASANTVRFDGVGMDTPDGLAAQNGAASFP